MATLVCAISKSFAFNSRICYSGFGVCNLVWVVIAIDRFSCGAYIMSTGRPYAHVHIVGRIIQEAQPAIFFFDLPKVRALLPVMP